MAPVTRRPVTAPAPLSVPQRQLWYLSQLAPESLAYNEMVTVRKTGHLDVDALRRALTEIVRRHQAWRTSFPLIDGEPRQLVHAPTSVALPLLDLTEVPLPEAQQRATELGAEDTRRPYQLTEGPLLRPRLVSLTPQDHRLYLGLHHLIFDGVTLYRIVLPELVRLYDARRARPPRWPNPRWSWWLHCYTGTDDIIFATMGDLRQRPELAGMAGYCLAPVVIRADTGDDPSLLELLARVRDVVLDGLGDIVPFEIIVRELGVVREPRMNPVFQATLVFSPPWSHPIRLGRYTRWNPRSALPLARRSST